MVAILAPGQINGDVPSLCFNRQLSAPTAVATAYKDSIAKSPEVFPGDEILKFPDACKPTPQDVCGQYAIAGRCVNGHTFARSLLCGREWCKSCGEYWSEAHQRRFSRLLYARTKDAGVEGGYRIEPRATQMHSIGRFVIEFPLASRHKYRTKAAWRDFGKRVTGSMKALGYSRGLRRWHWFGSRCPSCNEGNVVRLSGALVCDSCGVVFERLRLKFNPHMEVLIDGGWMVPKQLSDIKEYLRFALDEPQLIVNYKYYFSVGSKVHALKYATRSTFLDERWDGPMSAELYNFRNTAWWGDWDGPAVWSLADLGERREELVPGIDEHAVESLHANICPVCAEPMDWTRPIDVKALMYKKMIEIRRRVDSRARDAPLQSVTTRLIRDAQKVGQDLNMIKAIRDIQSRRGQTEPNLMPMDCVIKSGGVPVGAGYWRIPDYADRYASLDGLGGSCGT